MSFTGITETARSRISRRLRAWTFPRTAGAFATFDFDRDGDVDILLNNRNSPQLRLLRNDLPELASLRGLPAGRHREQPRRRGG